MERHLSHSAMICLFTGQAGQPEVDSVVAHLSPCRQCWDLAAQVVAELKRSGTPVCPPEGLNAVLAILEAEERQAIRQLQARVGWAELKNLPPEQWRERLEADASLQTREMVDTLIAAASTLSLEDPHRAEQTAVAAHVLAGILPKCPATLRNDLQGEAMLVVADCRRPAADWPGSSTALEATRRHLEWGTGDPVWEARLLAAEASLASGTGNREPALRLLSQAASIYRESKHPVALAAVMVQEAEILLADGRHEDAVARAKESLRLLSPRATRLEMQARRVITESLTRLGRPAEALQCFLAAKSLYEQFRCRWTELEKESLETLLLDAFQNITARQSAPVTQLAIRGHEEAIECCEQQLIAAGLAQCGGKVRETARLLGISRNTVRDKAKKYGMALSDGTCLEAPQPGGLALTEEARQALSQMQARSWWTEFKELSPGKQIDRLKKMAPVQTREMLETLIAAASNAALDDPSLGEETALAAFALAGSVSTSRCSVELKNDIQGEALLVVVNSRRLAAGWKESGAALAAARIHLIRGTGNPLLEARFLSIEASLAADTGNLDLALKCLSRASAILRRSQDAMAFARVTVHEAGTLLAACRHEEAIGRAEEALRCLPPREIRLEMLARSIITESLALLGRPIEALRSLLVIWPLYEHFEGRRSELRLCDLVALVLDALDYLQEAERAYRASIAAYMEAELYKDAFLTMLTQFASLFRRGLWARAAWACEEALAMIEEKGVAGHSQMIELWRDLLTLVNAQRLTEDQLLRARHYVARYWSASAMAGSAGVPALPRWDANGALAPAIVLEEPLERQLPLLAAEGQDRALLAIDPPPPVTRLAPGDYAEARKSYERQILTDALRQCGGCLAETSRRLGITPKTLSRKVKKYGLTGAALLFMPSRARAEGQPARKARRAGKGAARKRSGGAGANGSARSGS